MIPLIETAELSKDYKLDGVSVPAVRGIDLSISEGEMVSIMGPSGCGKSTLMHLLGLLDTPTSGKFFFRGRDMSRFSEDERSDFRCREIGFVFQQFNLLQRISALENVLLPTIYLRGSSDSRQSRSAPVFDSAHSTGSVRPESLSKGEAQTRGAGQTPGVFAFSLSRRLLLEEATKLLSEVGLSHRLNHRPNQLSGGEQQRVAIARSLINNPSLILADEPTGNLDSRSGKEILGILIGLNQKGKTVVVVTHDAEVASASQRVIQMKDGEVVG